MANIDALAWPEYSFQNAGHVDIKQWLRFTMAEQQDGIGYVLSNPGQCLNLLSISGKFPVLSRHYPCKGKK